jgi:hypothetical protein
MAKAKTTALSLELSTDGEQLVCFCKDYSIRLWRFRSGMLRRVYDESAEQMQEWQRGDDTRLKLEPIDYGTAVPLAAFTLNQALNQANAAMAMCARRHELCGEVAHGAVSLQ